MVMLPTVRGEAHGVIEQVDKGGGQFLGIAFDRDGLVGQVQAHLLSFGLRQLFHLPVGMPARILLHRHHQAVDDHFLGAQHVQVGHGIHQHAHLHGGVEHLLGML